MKRVSCKLCKIPVPKVDCRRWPVPEEKRGLMLYGLLLDEFLSIEEVKQLAKDPDHNGLYCKSHALNSYSAWLDRSVEQVSNINRVDVGRIVFVGVQDRKQHIVHLSDQMRTSIDDIVGRSVGVDTIRTHLLLESKWISVKEEDQPNIEIEPIADVKQPVNDLKPKRLRKEQHVGTKDPMYLLSIHGKQLPNPLRQRSRSLSPYSKIIGEINVGRLNENYKRMQAYDSIQVRNFDNADSRIPTSKGCANGNCKCCVQWKKEIAVNYHPRSSISIASESIALSRQNTGNSDYFPSTAPTLSSQPTLSDDEQLPKKTTSPDDLERYYLVQGKKLIDLATSCPKCHRQLLEDHAPVRISSNGSAPILHVRCPHCWTRSRPEQRWEGQPRSLQSTSDKTYAGNSAIISAVITTGMRWTNLLRFSHQLGLSMVSSASFYRQAKLVREAVDVVHSEREKLWLNAVKKAYEDSGNANDGWQLAMDGAYDSRGYSANIGKVVTADQLTNLIIGICTMHRSETDNVSTRMENEGIRRQIDWFTSKGIKIDSITTDRSRSSGKVIELANRDLHLNIKHYFDAWHIVKWLGNELRKQSKYAQCGQLLLWMQAVKTHAWNSIERGQQTGDPENIRYLLNSCVHHIRGEHNWTPNPDVTGSLCSCSHGPLPEREIDIVPNSNADARLCSTILNKKIQEDIVKANIRGTSMCEVKNALDRIYCPKEIWIPINTYPSAAKMSQMHLNELTMAELEGRRVVIKTYEIQRKFLTRKTTMKKKTVIEHSWRKDVHNCVLAIMYSKLEEKLKQRRLRAALKNDAPARIESDEDDADDEQDEDLRDDGQENEFRDDDDDIPGFDHRAYLDAIDSSDENDGYDSDDAPLGFIQGVVNGYYEKKEYKSYLGQRPLHHRLDESDDDDNRPLCSFRPL